MNQTEFFSPRVAGTRLRSFSLKQCHICLDYMVRFCEVGSACPVRRPTKERYATIASQCKRAHSISNSLFQSSFQVQRNMQALRRQHIQCSLVAVNLTTKNLIHFECQSGLNIDTSPFVSRKCVWLSVVLSAFRPRWWAVQSSQLIQGGRDWVAKRMHHCSCRSSLLSGLPLSDPHGPCNCSHCTQSTTY